MHTTVRVNTYCATVSSHYPMRITPIVRYLCLTPSKTPSATSVSGSLKSLHPQKRASALRLATEISKLLAAVVPTEAKRVP